MKLKNPRPRTVQVKVRYETDKDQHRIQITQTNPKKGKTIWSCTVYDTDLEEVKNLIIKTLEDHTNEKFTTRK